MKRALALLTTVHRWLGLVFCCLFIVWFVSGIVMMYKRMPEFAAEERLARLAAISPDTIRISPADAARAANVTAPRRMRVVNIGSRPAYQFLARQGWTTIYADDGSRFQPLAPEAAAALVTTLFGDHRGSPRYLTLHTVPDQWTFGVSIRTIGPLHAVSLGDDADTVVYVARDSGDVVMKTDRVSRFWGYSGAILHWVYFRPLRLQNVLWTNVIIYGSLLGCVLCVLGLVIGVARFSVTARYRGGASRSPYVGWLRWHHYAGLIFGVVTLTWVFSGMLSMTPWNWSPGSAPLPAQVHAVRGGEFDFARLASPADAIRVLQLTVRELELHQFLGQPLYEARRAGAGSTFVNATAPVRVLDLFSAEELRRAADIAMVGHRAREASWLADYDAYYYDKTGTRPLPVLRVKYDDPDDTWLYLSARDGQLVRREVTRTRIERWLYHGLHSFDFPGLYRTPWLWDTVVIVLSLGGTALSVTSLAIAWRYLKVRASPGTVAR